VIFRSRSRSNRWSRNAGGRPVHWIFGAALFTEGHAGELLLEPVLLLRITGGREAVRQRVLERRTGASL
jgi:hypothetical protein